MGKHDRARQEKQLRNEAHAQKLRSSKKEQPRRRSRSTRERRGETGDDVLVVFGVPVPEPLTTDVEPKGETK
jgi:hypothetical protein